MNSDMQQLIESKNWEETSLGAREHWPSTLSMLLNVMHHSRFPMFLFWGPDLISFYNDAFRPSLGIDGKHPYILGKPAKEAWIEIWDIIKPLLDQALSGEAVWREDLLVPFYRNGRIEDIYWTFSYSAVPDESGKIAGVLVICNETTEKILNTQKLTDSNNRFKSIVQEVPIGITIFRGRELIVEMTNKTYLEIVDREEEEVVGKPFFETFPELRDAVQHLLLGVLETGEPYYGTEFKVSLKRHGGKEDTYFNFVYHPLREDAAISGVIVVATEVTEQVRARYKLAESEGKFREMIMKSPIPMTIFRGSDYVIELANSVMFEKIWRKQEHEVIGKKLLDVFPELKDQKYPQLLRRVYQSGHVHNEKEAVAYVQGDDGLKKFILDYEYAPLFDEDNKVWGMFVTVNDVSEKVEARTTIEKSEEKLNVVIEASELGTWELDLKTREGIYSDRYLQILGYNERVTLQHQQLLDHIHPDDLSTRHAALAQALKTGKLYYEARLLWKDQSIHWMEARGKVFYDREGQPEKMLGTIRDITEEKNQKAILESFASELEKKVTERTIELKEKNSTLERMNEELQSFAYVSSHDLQEPLRKIQTFASRIKQKENLSERANDYFTRMEKAANQMQVLIQDLLAYSRTSTSDRRFETVKLQDIIDELKSDFEETLREKAGTIESVNLCEVKIIPLQFKQVMFNLISNSLKFASPERPPVIRIETTNGIKAEDLRTKFTPRDESYYRITVIDNGIGFDPLYKEKIFEVFQRLHGKHEYSGTGVGLAIVKKIIENHRGYIEAIAVPDSGARFDIYLPSH
ncbi:PAS domain-containing protein [Ohtaekwangia kribbensis]|jgi:PAS domain S-box-containing protein|uniref:histidine kinase n=1 Tax=Ohtaekwangia kribbensis TaxID=688913 RepID=A0ABW3K5V5_9BACT